MRDQTTSELAQDANAHWQHRLVRRARLANGSIIELEKECECKTHDGPHWLHMDEIARGFNRCILNTSGTPAEINAMIEGEKRRLAAKLHEMKKRNIIEIL